MRNQANNQALQKLLHLATQGDEWPCLPSASTGSQADAKYRAHHGPDSQVYVMLATLSIEKYQAHRGHDVR